MNIQEAKLILGFKEDYIPTKEEISKYYSY